MELPADTAKWMKRIGRALIGASVGASFGVAIGALVASWIWGAAAIDSEAVNASWTAAALTGFGCVVGAVAGFRVGPAPRR